MPSIMFQALIPPTNIRIAKTGIVLSAYLDHTGKKRRTDRVNNQSRTKNKNQCDENLNH